MIMNKVKVISMKIEIELPKEYIGKEIEYFIFPVETSQDKVLKVAGRLKKYKNIKKIREENSAWELHIKDKFK